MINRIVLVKPPEPGAVFDFGTYSLAALAAVVQDSADVVIVDATDMALREAAAQVWAQQPDLVGVTAMGYGSVTPVGAYLRMLRAGERDGGRVPLVAGGHGASMAPERLLRAGADAVVIGEGEDTFHEMVACGIQPGMRGTVCLGPDGDIVRGEPRPPIDPIARLPMPARRLMPAPRDGVHLLETSRGCPHACTFCETTRFYGRRWRAHSPERVVDEVRVLVRHHDAWVILLADDNFSASPRRVRRICDLLENERLPAFFAVSARADDLVADPALLPAMARARMLRVCVGVETLDPETASAVGKPVFLDTYRRAFQRMRELGMFSVASLIVGLPGETAQARAQTVSWLVEAAPDAAQFSPYLPLAGGPQFTESGDVTVRSHDLRDARAFTEAFYRRPAVRARLQDAVAEGGVRSLLARGVIEKQHEEER